MSRESSRLCAVASGFFMVFFLFSFTVNAQEVSAGIDTASIKIGEQIRYRISVKTDPSDEVVFPLGEKQTFSPMEMVEAYAIDTSKIDSRIQLIKEYALTKFDSGTYVIPPQRVAINNRPVMTDSFLVKVQGVMVDTTKQKMYAVKPPIDVPNPFRLPIWVWWLLGSLVVIAAIVLLVLQLKKKQAEKKREIPPFERAMQSLKQLDEGSLMQDEIKTYYSTLTDTARRYLDEQVDDRAMESTTDELIGRMQMRKDAGKLAIDQQIIDDFEKILKRADLAKFARSRPDIITAREDRGRIEKIIVDTKAGIPEPTEEELQQEETQQAENTKKYRRKRLLIGISAGSIVLLIAIAVVLTTQGSGFFRNLLGNETKHLLKSEWITSEYGNPPVSISTPEVLTRQVDSIQTDTAQPPAEVFAYGNITENLYIQLAIRPSKKNAPAAQPADDPVAAFLEAKGAVNIVTKQESFTTASGVEGVKVFGTFSVEDSEGKKHRQAYTALRFTHGGGTEQIVVVYDEKDPNAEKIASRVVYSVEFIKPGN